MENTIVIREARIEDSARLSELNGQLGYPSQPEQVVPRLVSLLVDPDQRIFVAERAGEGVIGWVHVYRQALLESDLSAEIGGLVVEESHRGKGIGGMLMQAAEAWARENGCTLVHLRSNIIREEAHAFYKRMGYEINKTQYSFIKELDRE